MLISLEPYLSSVKINASNPAGRFTHLHKHQLTSDAALILTPEVDQRRIETDPQAASVTFI